MLDTNKSIVRMSMFSRFNYRIFNSIGIIILCIIISRTAIVNNVMPFGLPMIAAAMLADGDYICALTGCLTGTLLFSKNHGLSNIISYVILILCYMFLNKKNFKLNKFKMSIVVFLSAAVTTLTLQLLSKQLLYEKLLNWIGVIISAFMVPVFYNSISFINKYKQRRIITEDERISLIILLSLTILGIGNIKIFNCSVRNIAVVFSILIAAYAEGAGTGASCGVAIGFALLIGAKADPFLIGYIGICGFFAGTFKEFKRIGTCAGFILADIIMILCISQSSASLLTIREIAAASLIFLLLPGKFIDYIYHYANETNTSCNQQNYYIKRVRDLTVRRIKEFSDVFSQMAAVIGQISENRKRISQDDVSKMLETVAAKVCNNCALKSNCWKRNFYNTYNTMFNILEMQESNGYITADDIPDDLKRKCLYTDKLVSAINDVFLSYKTNLDWQKKIDECRSLVGQQLDGVSRVTDDLANELNVNISFNEDTEDFLKEELDKIGIRTSEILVQQDDSKKTEVYIVKKSCGGLRECRKKVDSIVSKVIGKKMSLQNEICKYAVQKECVLIYKESPHFDVLTGIARKAETENEKCGDSYSFKGIKDGKYVLILSDGMGTGEQAYEESSAAVSLLEHFFEAGFQQDIVFKTINSILILKSSEEIYSTVDLCIIDLIEGYCDCIKIGAVTTYLKKGEIVEAIRASSLPIGIIDNVEPETTRRPIHDGDFIIMVTDGITDSVGSTLDEQDQWIAGLLGEMNTTNPQEIADKILQKTIEYTGGKINDDMSVMVTRIIEKYS